MTIPSGPREAMSIFDFRCEKCEEAGRDMVQVVMGAATGGRFSDDEVICGTCDSVIWIYEEAELVPNPIKPHGDDEDFRQFMAGTHPIQIALEEEE